MKATLYHASPVKIDNFDNNRVIWFSLVFEDMQKALLNWFEEAKGNGFIYKIEVDTEGCQTTSDFIEFHSGEILEKTGSNFAKMVSEDIDNNWFCFKNINLFNPQLI